MKRSWIESANDPEGHFPLDNLPYGVFSRGEGLPGCGAAIGALVVDLEALEEAGLLPVDGGEDGLGIFGEPFLNEFMEQGPQVWSAVRARLTELLAEGGAPDLREDAELRARALVPMDEARMHLPFHVTEYTDFFSGRQHAFNAGSMFRDPEHALPANWLHLPIAYNGRASTVVVSGTDVIRPMGQLKPHGADAPVWGASRRLDFELEMGAVVGLPSAMGERLSVAEAERSIFGYVLLNDWSARDIQAWEYQPLGPFQAKAFATTISPWVVTAEALAPHRAPAPEREEPLMEHLADDGDGLLDVHLAVTLTPEGAAPTTIVRTNADQLYYSAAQQLAHHSSSGCAMRCGDLLGSGTISGPERHEWGSLLELSWGGKTPVALEGGGERVFLEDGDAVVMTGWAQGEGHRIGFGACAGRILPAKET
ncbi:MAG: fumarylacetoacetase [Pseudomonadota bacterium]